MVKAYEHFHKHIRRKDGYDTQCRACRQAYEKIRNVRPHAKIAKRRYNMRRYDMTLEQYDLILETQGGVCFLCLRPPTDKRLAVDHDHKTGRVRGLLCSACNLALGLIESVPDPFSTLKAMATYLSPDSQVHTNHDLDSVYMIALNYDRDVDADNA